MSPFVETLSKKFPNSFPRIIWKRILLLSSTRRIPSYISPIDPMSRLSSPRHEKCDRSRNDPEPIPRTERGDADVRRRRRQSHTAHIFTRIVATQSFSVCGIYQPPKHPRGERERPTPLPPAVGCWLNNGPRREGTTCQLSRHECSDISSRSRARLRSDSILKHDSHSPPSANLPSNVRTTNAVGR